LRRSLAVPVFLLTCFFSCGSQRADVCRAGSAVGEAERWRAHLSLEVEDGFSGSVLVADGPRVTFAEESGRPAGDSVTTAFWIASISKVITAVAALRLVEEGRIDLHAPISTILPDVPPRWKAVTLHDLLGHRSGLPHAYAADGIADRHESLRAILDQEPANPPGEFEYSNDGFSMAAILIEVVSGESFESYVRSRVFQPAGMVSSGFWGFEPVPSPVALPARRERAERTASTIWHDGRSVANWGYRGPTGIWSTPGDLHRLIVALREGRILRAATFAEMISSKNPSVGRDATTYGYGMALRLQGGSLAEYWHGGNEDWLGHNGIVKVVGDRTYVVLTNSGDVRGDSWAHRIEAGLRACADPRPE
jgi:CubicO group peptidase (beta-lactamase class C family)